MDPSEFTIARKTQLDEFKKNYDSMKGEYSDAVVKALKEQDRSKQCLLIKQVLDINKKITAYLKSFNINMNTGTCKANPGLKPKIQSDLEKYNREHEEIQQGRDQLTGLTNSIKRANEKTKEVHDIFSWYTILIFLSIAVLIFIIVFRVGSYALNTQSSVPVLSGGHR